MENKISYQNWPLLPKIVTALSTKKLFVKLVIKNHKTILYLGYFVLVIGLIGLIYAFTQTIKEIRDLLEPISYIVIGLVNIMNASAIKWINLNSSWEERFDNKSSVTHKAINIFVLALLLASAYVIVRNTFWGSF